jgi:AMMECR1 domain-containing protein
VGLKESLKSVLTPARHGTMCERKTSEYRGRRKHFSETMPLFVTFHEKNTAATAVTVCLGTTACRIATGVG